MKQILQEEWNVNISVQNDGKCAAIAEKELGSLKDYKDCIFLNIGTGIGGAVFLKGEMLAPQICTGFEIGHMTIEKNGKNCTCGKKGCFETYASMRNLKETIRREYQLGQEVHSRELLEILSDGSEKSNQMLEEYIENLKVGIANLIDLFEPEAISIGGSFAYYKDIFIDPLKQKLFEEHSTFNQRKDIIIKVAQMQNDAGILGAVI